jgi:hypothetical protein
VNVSFRVDAWVVDAERQRGDAIAFAAAQLVERAAEDADDDRAAAWCSEDRFRPTSAAAR